MIKKIWKITLPILLTVLTTANVAGLVIVDRQVRRQDKPTNFSKPTAKAKLDIKTSKEVEIPDDKLGVKFAEGDYAYEEQQNSKLQSDSPGKLMIASNEGSSAHFVLAATGDNDIETKVAPGWSVQTVSDDPMWAPAGCGSKPTYLISDNFIFIDDGKISQDDKYSGYIMFNIQTGVYRYFGGNHFTEIQGAQEKILSTSYQDGKVVFYIEQTDDNGPVAKSSNFKHSTSSDHGYIVRRVIDPATLHYEDYRIAYTLPSSVDLYFIRYFYGNTLTVDDDTHGRAFQGEIANNRIALKAYNDNDAGYQSQNTGDSQLELALDVDLSKQLSSFIGAPAYENSIFKTQFSIAEIGSHENTQYLMVSNRYGDTYESPAVYDQDSKNLSLLTTTKYLNFSNTVSLGVF